MVSGVLAERLPDSVRAIRDGGHEIVAHSYGMDVIPVYLDEAAEIANIRRNTGLLEEAAGVRPTGWISPRGTGSLASPRLLAAEGYQWHGDCNDDDLPAILEFADGARTRSIVAIPLTMDLNDLPHSNRYGGSAEAFVAKFQAGAGRRGRGRRRALHARRDGPHPRLRPPRRSLGVRCLHENRQGQGRHLDRHARRDRRAHACLAGGLCLSAALALAAPDAIYSVA